MTLTLWLACSRGAPPPDETPDDTPEPTSETDTDTPTGGGGGGGGGAGPADGTLLLTEVGDHASLSQVKYVEVVNPGSQPVGLSGWSIVRYSNGGTEGVAIPLGEGDLAAGAAFVVANLDGAADYESAFGGPADLASDECNGNGNDAWVLAYAGETVDTFGEVGVDGLGSDWDYTDAIAVRQTTATAPQATWVASEWTISAGTSAASPGSWSGGGTVEPTEPSESSIRAVRQGDVAIGANVIVTGTATGIAPYGLFIQEPGADLWSGVWVYTGASFIDLSPPSVGDAITAMGTVTDFNGLTEIDASALGGFILASPGGDAITPLSIGLADLLADPEPYESMLLTVVDVEVVDTADTYGEWRIADAVDNDLQLAVDDLIYEVADLDVGDPISSLTGPLYYSFGEYKVEPRGAYDVAL